MRATLPAAVLGSALLLGGCGIKGPLYLPKAPPAQGAAAAPSGADHSKAPIPPIESK